MPEMDAIEKLIEERSPERAVVVGGGFIGLEMAEALHDRGLDVSLVEFLPHVMPNLDPELAQVLQSELAARGVSLHTGVAVEQIHDDRVTLGDGTEIDAELVLMSIGVAPATELAQRTGLEIGATGGVAVNEYLESSVPDIYVAGDMAEIAHTVSGKRVRIPLAGPANRQGRIAATNALGGRMRYNGASGTSIVKLFGVQAGSVGLSEKQAHEAGIDAESVVVHKADHASYYPGSEDLSIKLTYDRADGTLLGAQVAGGAGVDKRVDVLSTAIRGKLTIHDLGELDLAYAPPFSSANDPVNMAAFVAENRLSGYGPSITADEIDDVLARGPHTLLDVRDEDEVQAGRVHGAIAIPLYELRAHLDEIPGDRPILVFCESGQRSHLAARLLLQSGFESVTNIAGAYTSLERHARAVGFREIAVDLRENYGGGCTARLPDLPLPGKEEASAGAGGSGSTAGEPDSSSIDADDLDAVVVDVRSTMEFAAGAYPGAMNIPVEQLAARLDELGDRRTPITVYCASGSRSAYAEALLRSQGFTNVTNGGGLAEMLVRR
jgi:rhodanese-related sulfurtransferase